MPSSLKREIYFIEDGEQETRDDTHTITTNPIWFKLLGLVSFSCALFVCAALVWLLVCRPARLPRTDSQLKRDALVADTRRRRRKSCWIREKRRFRRRLRYLLFGPLNIRSPPTTSYSSSSSSSHLHSRLISSCQVNEKENKSNIKKPK